MSSNINKFHTTKNIKDPYHNALIKKGVNYKFEPALEGLNTLTFETDTDGKKFGTKIIDNTILFNNYTFRVAFDDEEIVDNIGVDINQTNNDPSDDVVDPNRTGSTESAGVSS